MTRFLDKSGFLRRIRSPNVVTVHDVGRLNDGRPCFVMDFADRGTLAERIRPEAHGKPDPRRLTVLIDALADGLAAIHAAGVVHRDIKRSEARRLGKECVSTCISRWWTST